MLSCYVRCAALLSCDLQVFFQQKAFNKIEKLRTGIVAGAALKMQTFWRSKHARRAYLIKKGLLKGVDDSRRVKGLAACTIQRCGKRYALPADVGLICHHTMRRMRTIRATFARGALACMHDHDKSLPLLLSQG